MKINYKFHNNNQEIKRPKSSMPQQKNKNLIKNIYPDYKNDYNINNDNFITNINNNSNNINLLNKKIINQQMEIELLKSNIIHLNEEKEKVEDELKKKNNIISEFQKLSQMTKDKIETYLLKNNIQKNQYEKKLENYNNIQIENNKLSQKIIMLENENKELQKKIKENEYKNKTEIDTVKNDINSLKKDYENTLKENSYIINERNKKKRENEELQKKIILLENRINELDDIKKNNILLKSEINEKDNNIKELKILNENLQNRFFNSNNFNRIINEQSNYKSNLRTKENLRTKKNSNYRYKRINDNNDKFYRIPMIKKSNNSMNKRLINSVYYSLIKNRKLIESNDTFTNNNKKELSINNNSYNSYNIANIRNRIKRISNRTIKPYNLNKNYYIPHASRPQYFEKSFDNSNYLLDNLKRRISKNSFK